MKHYEKQFYSRKTWRPSPTALLNPRRDEIFKAIFTQDTPESKGALLSFLEAAIGREISDVEVVENDVPVEHENGRGVQFDVHCVFKDGTVAEVEMEGRQRDYDYGVRAEYSVARLLSAHARVGQDWKSMPVAYQISVLDFTYEKGDSNAVHRYQMYDVKNNSTLTGILNIIFLELPKLPLAGKCETKNLTNLQKWGMFLKNADKERHIDLVRALANENKGIEMATVTLGKISDEKYRWYVEWQIEKHERDRISEINAAKRRMDEAIAKSTAEGIAKGMKQGLERGKAEGIAEGEHKKAIETARALLALGVVTTEQIAQATGLSLAEVQELG